MSSSRDQLYARAACLPEALACFVEWSETLRTTVPPRMAQAIALTASVRAGSAYQRVEHERLALACGLTPDEVQALETGNLSRAPSLSEEEGAAAALTRCMLDNFGLGCEPAFLRLSRLVGEPTAVACLMIAVSASSQAAMANVWGLEPPAPAVGAETPDTAAGIA